MAVGSSHPPQSGLVGVGFVAAALGCSRQAVLQRLQRGTFPIPPAVTTDGGWRYWDKDAVLRAAALLKPAAPSQ